jgi:hypothetical protein
LAAAGPHMQALTKRGLGPAHIPAACRRPRGTKYRAGRALPVAGAAGRFVYAVAGVQFAGCESVSQFDWETNVQEMYSIQ